MTDKSDRPGAVIGVVIIIIVKVHFNYSRLLNGFLLGINYDSHTKCTKIPGQLVFALC